MAQSTSPNSAHNIQWPLSKFDTQSDDCYDYPAFIDVEEPVPILDPPDTAQERSLRADGYEERSRPWPKAPTITRRYDGEVATIDAPDGRIQDINTLPLEDNEPESHAPYHNIGYVRIKPQSTNRSPRRPDVSKNTAVAGSKNANRRSNI